MDVFGQMISLKIRSNKSYNYAEINFYVFTVTYGTNSPAASKKQDTSQ